MNVIQFLDLVEGYYGKYERTAQKNIIRQYLVEKYAPGCEQLDALYKRLLLEYSGQFRYAPDIAILEGIRRQLNTEVDGWRIGDVKLLPPGGRRTPKEMSEGLQEVLEGLVGAKRLKEQEK